ncbi:MAG: glycosyltransferase [Eubacteriales bacterium]|nr:glycosyltransferase [Eubacteriales bacterium]
MNLKNTVLVKIRKILKGLKILAVEGYTAFCYRLENRGIESKAQFGLYERWIAANEKDKNSVKKLEYNPLISVVIPVYNVPDNMLIECIESVLAQTYENWQLCLADDHSSWESMRTILKKYEDNPKVKVVYREENGHISRATNSAIEVADGEFIAFMDCDDIIPVNALYEVACKLNENPDYDFIYTDEDKIDEEGKKRWDPHFKPDWSPDTLMTMMYTSHLGVYRASIVKELGGLRPGFEGSQDYDFTLRFVEKTKNIGHIAKVLYHWRQREGSTAAEAGAKPYVFEAARKAKEEAFARRNVNGSTDEEIQYNQIHVTYHNDDNILVSIIIPSKDNYEVYRRCVETLNDITDYSNYEIIHVDNGSNDENKRKYEALDKKFGHHYLYEKMEFNFSRMCNIGAKIAKGQYLLFLNDDIEIIRSEWLGLLLGQASLPHSGAVGAKLYYPNSTLIQHCGVVNIAPGPSHILCGYDDKEIYYFGRNKLEYNVIAVTGACLMIKKSKFYEIGGFDESLAVAYNDVDLCFSLLEAGYYNVVRNDAILYHHESLSRGYDTVDEKKMRRLEEERNKLYKKHPNYYKKDPFYNDNLTQNNVNFSIREEKYQGNNSLKVLQATNDFNEDRNICAEFDCITVMEEQSVFLQGYAYYKNRFFNNHGRVQVLLQSETENLLVETNKIYRPDLQHIQKTKRHINMSGFQCYIDKDKLKDTKYDMAILLDGKASGEKGLLEI